MIQKNNRVVAGLCLAASLVAMAGTANAERIYATTGVGFLVSFDSATPALTLSGAAISGLDQNESIIGLDFRPSDGRLYGHGSFNNLYTLDTATGAATLVGPISGATLTGSAFGFDFNPVVDLARVVSDTGLNARVNPTTLIATVDTNLAYAAGDVNFGVDPDASFAAYTNNIAGATTTQLFLIDSDLDVLTLAGTPNNGQLTTRGPLGINAGSRGGFDVSGATGIAYLAALPVGDSTSKLYRVNLATGAATLVDEIGGGLELRTMTVVPAPGVASAFLIGGLALARKRRR